MIRRIEVPQQPKAIQIPKQAPVHVRTHAPGAGHIFTPPGTLAQAPVYATPEQMAEEVRRATRRGRRRGGGQAEDVIVPDPPPVPTTYTILGSNVPGTIDANDGSAYTMGVLFKSSVDAQVVGVRFYKATANTGVHVGYLWDLVQDNGSSISVLASNAFSGETAIGWQQVLFDTPINITAGVVYKAGVYMPNGHYSYDNHYYLTNVVNGILTALANDDSNGRLRNNGFASGLAYPDTGVIGAGNNYWVDVMVQA